jgi:hypothetical protein
MFGGPGKLGRRANSLIHEERINRSIYILSCRLSPPFQPVLNPWRHCHEGGIINTGQVHQPNYT